MDTMKIQVLEKHSQSIRIILILNEVGSLNFQSFIDSYAISSATLYRTLNALIEVGIIVSNVDTSSYPKRTILSLSSKGKTIAEFLNKIEQILEVDAR